MFVSGSLRGRTRGEKVNLLVRLVVAALGAAIALGLWVIGMGVLILLYFGGRLK